MRLERPRLVLYLGAALAPRSHRKRRAGFPQLPTSGNMHIPPQRVKADNPTSASPWPHAGVGSEKMCVGLAGQRR